MLPLTSEWPKLKGKRHLDHLFDFHAVLFRFEKLPNGAYFVFFKEGTSSFVVHLTTGNRCDLVYTFNSQERKPFECINVISQDYMYL